MQVRRLSTGNLNGCFCRLAIGASPRCREKQAQKKTAARLGAAASIKAGL